MLLDTHKSLLGEKMNNDPPSAPLAPPPSAKHKGGISKTSRSNVMKMTGVVLIIFRIRATEKE